MIIGYDEFTGTLVRYGVREHTIADGMRLYNKKKFKVSKFIYRRDVKHPVGAILFVDSRTREGVTHIVTVGEETVKCTCEDSVYNGNICAHMVVGLRLMYDIYRVRGKEFPLEHVLRKYLGMQEKAKVLVR